MVDDGAGDEGAAEGVVTGGAVGVDEEGDFSAGVEGAGGFGVEVEGGDGGGADGDGAGGVAVGAEVGEPGGGVAVGGLPEVVDGVGFGQIGAPEGDGFGVEAAGFVGAAAAAVEPAAGGFVEGGLPELALVVAVGGGVEEAEGEGGVGFVEGGVEGGEGVGCWGCGVDDDLRSVDGFGLLSHCVLLRSAAGEWMVNGWGRLGADPSDKVIDRTYLPALVVAL